MKRIMPILFGVVLVCGAFILGLFLPTWTGVRIGGQPAEAAPVAEAPAMEQPPAVQTQEIPVTVAAPAFSRAEAPVLRVKGGVVEWFDGAEWHAYETADALAEDDPVAAAVRDRLAALSESMPVLPENPYGRAEGAVRSGGGGGGSSGGGSGGGSDGQDIEWSGDQL